MQGSVDPTFYLETYRASLIYGILRGLLGEKARIYTEGRRCS